MEKINKNEERFIDEMNGRTNGGRDWSDIYEEMKYMRIALRCKEEFCVMIDGTLLRRW